MSPDKRCADCRVRKPLDQFRRDRSKRDGRDCSCKQCRKNRWQKLKHKRPSLMPDRPIFDGVSQECRQCGQVKPISEYYINASYRTGYESECKVCRQARKRARRIADRAPRRERYFDGDFRECSKCERVLPISEFHRDRTTKTGYSPWCKTCRKYTRGHGEGTYSPAFKQELIDLLGGGCALCGFNTYLTALQFHHVDPNDKNVLISKLLKRYQALCDQLLAELDKCCLLCANCHQALHAREIDVIYAKRQGVGWKARLLR